MAAPSPASHWQSLFIAVASARVIGFSFGWYGQAARIIKQIVEFAVNLARPQDHLIHKARREEAPLSAHLREYLLAPYILPMAFGITETSSSTVRHILIAGQRRRHAGSSLQYASSSFMRPRTGLSPESSAQERSR